MIRLQKYLFITVVSCAFCICGYAQQPDTLIKKLDSLRAATDTTKQVNNTDKTVYTEQTKINVGTYFVLLGSNLKQSFTKPFHMKKKDWGNLAKFALLETALTFADKPIQRNAVDWSKNSPTVRWLSNYITRFGGLYEVYTLAALMAESYITGNRKLRTTTLLASQSYLTAGGVQLAAKFIFGRQRPSYIDHQSLKPQPDFQGPFYKSTDATGRKTNSAFPSGHTTGVFAAATVYSLEYKDKGWVPWFSYSIATLIGLTRITENKHWLTDIVAGAALGYITGQQVVNNYHRYAQIKRGETSLQPKKKNTLSFNLSISDGVVMPGMIYQFR